MSQEGSGKRGSRADSSVPEDEQVYIPPATQRQFFDNDDNSDPMPGSKRSYKSYLHEATYEESKIPRTTKWRHKQQEASQIRNKDNTVSAVPINTCDDNYMKMDERCKLSPGYSEGLEENIPISEDIMSTLRNSYDESIKDTEERNISDCESTDGNASCTSDGDSDNEDNVMFDASPTEPSDDKLYPGAEISILECFMLIMTLSVRHALTFAAINDILALIRTICPQPCQIVSSVKQIWKYFGSIDEEKIPHFYCSPCFKYLGSRNVPGNLKVCSGCKKECKGNIEYFLQIPLVKQIKKLCETDGFLTLLKHRFERSCDASCIKDVYDGKVYQELFRDNGFLADPHNISLQLNTDGVSIFKSSKVSVWPIYITINELPPKLRFSRNMRIFCGFWFGKSKPKMFTFLQPLADELFRAYENGIPVVADGSDITIRAVLLSACFDAPAKCMFQGFTQFNGEYGCGFCMEKGKVVPSGKGYARVYPFNDKHSSNTGHDDIRTHSQTKKDALMAEQRRTGGKRRPVNGVLELSWPLIFPQFDIIRGVPTDYMHAVLLGVVKLLMMLWFGKAYSKQPWSCYAHLEECDKRRLQIQPPHYVKRIPRSIAVYGTNYKAAEYRTWLLYYLYPVMKDILPIRYLHHALLLINGIYLLLKESISKKEIWDSTQMLQHFCIRFPSLYMESKCTYNIHQLLHLPECVVDLGPLWCSSCFFYEDLNGDLRKLFHGSQGFDIQIANAAFWLQEINSFKIRFSSPSALQLYGKLKNPRAGSSKQQQISDGVIFWGDGENCLLEDRFEKEALETFSGCQIERIKKFYRFSVDNNIFHTKQYKRVKRRNSFTVLLEGKQVAFVQYVFSYRVFCGHAACRDVKNCYDLTEESGALVSICKDLPALQPRSDSLHGPRANMKFVRVVAPSQCICKAVPIRHIVKKVLFAQVADEGYVLQPPNSIEKE